MINDVSPHNEIGKKMNTLDKINTVMLCDLMIHHGVTSSLSPETVKYAVKSGNLWILDAAYSHLGQSEPPKSVRDLTVNILNMYRGLSQALRALPPEAQEELKAKYNLEIHDKNIQIPGFDGNNEYEYVSVVEAFHIIDRFTEQQEPIGNTHSESISSYEAMLSTYNSLSPRERRNELTHAEISSVLAEEPSHF